jgi:hypothetical protein
MENDMRKDWEFYYRRGNKFFFRTLSHKEHVSFIARDDYAKQLRESLDRSIKMKIYIDTEKTVIHDIRPK